MFCAKSTDFQRQPNMDARVVELVDSLASGASARKGVRVRLPPRAPRRSKRHIVCSDFFTKVRARSRRCSSFPNRTRCRWASVWGRSAGGCFLFLTDRSISTGLYKKETTRPASGFLFGISAASGHLPSSVVQCLGELNPTVPRFWM